MIQKLKNKKVHLTFGAVAVIAGIIFVQNGFGNKPPKIDAISPSPGYQGIVLTITGSGFTKQLENVTETRIGNDKFAPGNYIKILGQIQDSHAFSLDGTTLQIKLDLNTNHVVAECAKRTVQNKSCDVGIKVVNAYGIESNEFHYVVTNKPPLPPLRASYERIPLDPTNPTQSIAVHISDTQLGNLTEVYRYKLTADPKNDASVYVWATAPYAQSSDSQPMDCSKIFSAPGPGVSIIDTQTNQGDWSTFGLGANNINSTSWGLCISSGGLYFPIAPGEQKIISLRMGAGFTAPVGLQFSLSSSNSISSSPDNPGSPAGDRDVLISNSTGVDWLDGGGGQTNYIAIAP